MLNKIIAHKKEEVARRKAKREQFDINHLPPTRPFIDALSNKNPAIIAEIKKASPSKGVISNDFNVLKTALAYERSGAACLSVLTDEHFFQGHDDYLIEARNAVNIPVLRKDFIIDDYQIYETRSLGADAILLIVAALTDTQLKDYYHLASKLGLHVLIECHNQEELDKALSLDPALIGINNRDLKTFNTDLHTTLSLLPHIPDNITVVTESGIASKKDIDFFLNHGVSTFLIGELFMKTPNPGLTLSNLLENKV